MFYAPARVYMHSTRYRRTDHSERPVITNATHPLHVLISNSFYPI